MRGGYHRRRRRARRWLMLELACAAALLAVIVLMGVKMARGQDRQAEEQEAAAMLAEIAQPTMQPAQEIEEAPPILEGAKALLERNADTVGMVGYGDMSLYVCQSEDNAYYASHLFDKSEDPAGMIYMDYRCELWPRSENIILYGHNMKDGSRFGKLKRLTRQAYLDQYPMIRFASLYQLDDYEPVAIFYANVNEGAADYFDFAQVSFADAAAYDAYIQAARARSVLNLPRVPNYGEPLLTLATCSAAGEGGRLVVVCAKA